MKKVFISLIAIAAFAFTASAQEESSNDRNMKMKEHHGMHKGHGERDMLAWKS